MRGGVELIIGAIRTGTHVSMLKSIVVLKYIKLFTVEMSKVFFFKKVAMSIFYMYYYYFHDWLI